MSIDVIFTGTSADNNKVGQLKLVTLYLK